MLLLTENEFGGGEAHSRPDTHKIAQKALPLPRSAEYFPCSSVWEESAPGRGWQTPARPGHVSLLRGEAE